MNTVFGIKLIGWEDFEENQLLRCAKHKSIEGKLLLEMPPNTSFLDIGAHYGDTVLTMASYAKNNNRNDIRFFAFEPNQKKCEHIKKISELNDLDVTIFNNCVGNSNSKAVNDGIVNSNYGASSFIPDDNGNIDIIKLDDLREQLGQIGFMHIDAEGWETYILQGANNILSDKSNKMYIVAEYWDNCVATEQFNRGRGFSCNPKDDILNEMSKYNCVRLDDIVDNEENLLFMVNH